MSNYIRLVTFSVEDVPTFSGGAYAKDDRLGSVQELFIKTATTDFINLINLQIIDKTGNAATMEVFFFSSNPLTLSADNAAFDIDASDCQYYHGSIAVVALDWFFTANRAMVTIPTQIPMKLSPESKIFVAVKATKGASYTDGDLIFRYYFSMDSSGQ